jgi:hypothetical protein
MREYYDSIDDQFYPLDSTMTTTQSTSQETPKQPHRSVTPQGEPNPPDDGSSSSSSDDTHVSDGNGRRRPPGGGGLPGGGPPDGGGGNGGNGGGGNPGNPRRPNPRGQGGGGGPPPPHNQAGALAPRLPRAFAPDPFHFDRKMKIGDVPEWDGADDTLLEWLEKVNLLAQRSRNIYMELGQIIPIRLTDKAAAWFYALDERTKEEIQRSWGDIKLALTNYFMTHTWTLKMQTRAWRIRYRQKGNESESPVDYFSRKLKMLQLLFTFTDEQLILEILEGAPKFWTLYINTSTLQTVGDLQSAIKHHEPDLYSDPRVTQHDFEKRLKALEHAKSSKYVRTHQADTNFVKPANKRSTPKRTTKLIGSHPKFTEYKYPKDDSIRSKGKTPAEKGARPCKYCGSGNHWDNDHPVKPEDRRIKTFLADMDQDVLQAYLAYEDCYFSRNNSDLSEQSSSEEDTDVPTSDSDEDFHPPLN